MSEPKPSREDKKPKRGWVKKTVRGIGWLLLFLLIFHRPLIHYGVPPLVSLIAKKQNLNVDFKLSGSIVTNLIVTDVHVTPSGSGPTPVQKIDIAAMQFHYSLPRLIRNGIGEFLSSYELHDADLAFVALPSKTEKEKKDKVTLAHLLNSILAQPAAYADRALIENVKVRVQSPETKTVVGPIDLLLDPAKPGYLRIGRLQAPGIPVWENLSATTSYTNRNLFIRDLTLAPELVINSINFDASRRAQGAGTMSLSAQIFGGNLSLNLSGQALKTSGKMLDKSYSIHLILDAAGIDVAAAMEYFGAPKPPIGDLGKLALDFRGEPEMPDTWTTTAVISLDEITAGGLAIRAIQLNLDSKDGQAELRVGAEIASNKARLEATASLPPSLDQFRASSVKAQLKLDVPKLEEIGEKLEPPQPIRGNATALVNVTMQDRRLTTDLTASLDGIAFGEQAIEKGELTLRGTLPADFKAAAPLTGLSADLSLQLSALKAGTFNVDSARITAGAREREITLQSVEILRGDNSVTAKGAFTLAQDFTQFTKTPGDINFEINVPRLADFGLGGEGKIVAGQIKGSGRIHVENEQPSGSITIDGSDFTFAGGKADALTARIELNGSSAEIKELALKLNDQDRISMTGHIGTQKPFAYDGSLDVGLHDLTIFQSLLEGFGVDKKLSGAVTLNWTGQGEAQPANHTGEMKLAVDAVAFGEIKVNELRLDGVYSPEKVESREFHVVSGPTTLDGAIEWEEKKLRLLNLDLKQGGQQALSGFIIVPFDPGNPKGPVPFDERIAVNFNAKDLDLTQLLSSFGPKPPVSARFSWNLLASGTILDPNVNLTVNATGIKADAAAQFDPAEVDLAVHLAKKQVELEATARQPLIQPLQIKGQAPFNVERMITRKEFNMQTPLDASVVLPATSLAVLPKIVPAIRRLDGTVAVNIRVGGTVEKPGITGQTSIRVKEARMVAENIPKVTDFTADLDFTTDNVALRTFRGTVGGGSFNLDGKIGLADLKKPTFDLRLKAKQVLGMRNDSITVRADADLALKGPLDAAAATGTVWVVQSRFFKEIDILPIGLPGRPKPVPKSAPSQTNISFPNPPLRDWKFDIAIKTRPDDPFLIIGNLANGAAHIDLKFGGTGLKPWLDGLVRVENFKASLPFSTLDITQGYVYFSKDVPFEPSLDIQAESRMRDYVIRAFIQGTATHPQIEFTSEPPLSHADIVSLLATGTTASELGSNSDVLASKAAMLAIKSLYRKIFNKGAPPPKGTDDENFLDRFDVEIGAIDAQTGAQEVKARFEVTDQTFILGELDTEGHFTGSLKYLIRFR